VTGAKRAAWSVGLGLLATLALPVAIVATRYSGSYDLLHAAVAIPFAMVAGIAAIVLARRVRALNRARLEGAGGGKAAAWGRIFGILGVCLAASATISVAVYGVLIAAD
jgi:hypothetical protein